MRNRWLTILTVTGIAALLVSCAPEIVPTLPPTPVESARPRATTSPAAPAISPEDAVWEKIIQAAKKEGKINAYSFNMTTDVGRAVSEGFYQKYGIKVEIITGGGSALSERIKTEKRIGSMVADIMDANSFQISDLKDLGATVSSREIPVLREKVEWLIDPWANDPERHIFIHTLTYLANTVNTNLVKPGDEPKSIKELTQPRWKGRIAVFDPRQNSGISTVYPTLIARKLIDLETVRLLGMNDIKYFPTSSEPGRSVIQGERALYLQGSTANLAPLIALAGTSVPVKAVDAEEGTVATNRALGALKDSPHPNAAKVFINWILSQDGQNVFVRAQGGVPVRKDVPDFTPKELRYTPARLIVPTPEEEKENTRLFKEGWLAKLWGR